MNDTKPLEALALASFRQAPLKLNCAQAVLHAHRAVHADCALQLEDFAAMGAGRAPEGLCGALHAACVIRPERAEALKEEFRAAAGAIHCHTLKRELGFPCPDSVALAVRLGESRA